MSENTAVKEEDLPKPEVTYLNVPEDAEASLQRILLLEMVLEDLARAVEIATVTGSWNILETFCTSANDVLATKIEIVQPNFGEMKVQTIHNDMPDDFDLTNGRVTIKE